MKNKIQKDLLIDLGASISVLVVLSAILLLPILLLPMTLVKFPIWANIAIMAAIFIIFVAFVTYLLQWLLKSKNQRVIPLCIMEIGLVFIFLCYYKDFLSQIKWDVGIFGIGVTIIALGITLLTVGKPREPKEAAIMDDSNHVEESQNEQSKVLDTNADFLYMLTSNRLQNQLQQIESLDSKTISLLGFSCTLTAILAAAIAIIEITSSEIIVSYVLLGISVSAFIFIAIVSLKSYFTKPWRVGADIQEAWEHSKTYAQHKMLLWAAKSFTEGYNINREPVKNKIFAIKKVSIALIIQVISLILSVILIYLY